MYTPWKSKSYRADFEAALERAYQTFANLYPDWAGYYFDEHFLTHQADHLLARYRDETIAPDARHLASAWARQMRWIDASTRDRRIAELQPAAAHFLCLLQLELSFPLSAGQSILSSTRPECDPIVITASRS